MAEDTLLYKSMTATAGFKNPHSGTGRVGFGNLAKDYAALNRKNMRQTDNKGYPLCYVVQVEAIGDTTQGHQVEIYTAPETWVLKNAVRKWHLARNEMLARGDALGKVGEYGRTLRPYLSKSHAFSGDIRPTFFQVKHDTTYSGGPTYIESNQNVVGGIANGGEWTYTKIASFAEAEEQKIPRPQNYHLVLTGDHSNDAGEENTLATGDGLRFYTHVSMMRSYLESRRNTAAIIQTNDGQGTIQQEPNPLSIVMSGSGSQSEVNEIVQDHQREKPPYDMFANSADEALNANDALDLVQKCFLSTSTTYLKDAALIRVPLGLFHVRASASAAIGSSSVTPGIRFKLLGIEKCQG